MFLCSLHDKIGLEKIITASYQAASGAGAAGMAGLEDGLEWYFIASPKVFAYQVSFSIIPQINVFQENCYTKQEMKVTLPLHKIFGLSGDMKVSCTSCRVPTLSRL